MKLRISKKWGIVGALVLAIGVVAAGFIGFYALIVPRLLGLSTLSLLAVTVFSFGAGVLSFFAPCSVAIFPSYMGYYLSETGETNRFQALKYGVTASAGMILFYGLLGVFVSYIGGLTSVQSILLVGIPLMAAVLGAVGVYFLTGNMFNLKLLASTSSRFINYGEVTSRNLFLFGFGYSMGSIACIFPVFLLLIVYPLITGNTVLGFMAFIAFSLGKSSLMVLATLLASESKSQVLTSKNLHFDYIKQGSGFLLIAVSLYLTYYALTLHGAINPV